MEENDDVDHQRHPLSHVILCCTAIPQEQRTSIANAAKEMGAEHKLDLTTDVTHLIVGSVDTPKYKYVAKNRMDVVVLKPGWMQAVLEAWKEDTLDLARLEEEYKVPPLWNLKISITNFEDTDTRQEIADLVAAGGGDYHADLTKKVTHLIAFSTVGKKYQFALQYGMKIVDLQWLRDTMERGMVLDEDSYSLNKPKEERGKDAWLRPTPSEVQQNKRPRPDDPSSLSGRDAAGKRKLRRTASARVSGQNIWENITGEGSSKNIVQVDRDHLWEDSNADVQIDQQLDPGDSVVPPHMPTLPTSIDLGRSFMRPTAKLPVEVQPDLSRGIFQGRVVHIYGFDTQQTARLHDLLVPQGALVAPSESQLSTYSIEELHRGFLLQPSATTESISFSIPPSARQMARVTEWWVEKCLHYKKLFEASADVMSRPLPKFDQREFLDLHIGSTGFTGYDLLHLSKAVQMMGATYDETVTSKTSFIIYRATANPRIEKLKFAYDNGIPLISEDWLLDCIKDGRRRTHDFYRVLSPPDFKDRLDKHVEKSADAQISKGPDRHNNATLERQDGTRAPTIETPTEFTPADRKTLPKQKAKPELRPQIDPPGELAQVQKRQRSTRRNDAMVAPDGDHDDIVSINAQRVDPINFSGQKTNDGFISLDDDTDSFILPPEPAPPVLSKAPVASRPRSGRVLRPLTSTVASPRKIPSPPRLVSADSNSSALSAPPPTYPNPFPSSSTGSGIPQPPVTETRSTPQASAIESKVSERLAENITNLSNLLAVKRQTSSSRPGLAEGITGRDRRERGKLGRAPSGASIGHDGSRRPSTEARTLQRTKTNESTASIGSEPFETAPQSQEPLWKINAEAEERRRRAEPPQPSQVLGYEDDEQRLMREEVFMKLGGKLLEDETRQRIIIGTVKDAAGYGANVTGVGRLRARRREDTNDQVTF